MWAVNIEHSGKHFYIPCGNDGFQKLRNKTPKGWKRETYIMRHNGGDVYVINNYTQRMSEMKPGELVDYVMENHICLLPRVTTEEVLQYRREQDEQI